MASGDGNHLAIFGPAHTHYGYGRLHNSLRDELDKIVTLSDTASTAVFVLQPTMVKGWYAGQYRVLFTMWEADVLPQTMHELFPQFDMIVVPCDHNKEIFDKYHSNVAVVPLGIDTQLWKPQLNKKRREGPFRFLAGGSHWRRKGLDVVVEAFNRLDMDAELHLKCRMDIIGGVPKINNNRIVLHRELMTEEEERNLYWDSDCFISMSRGEGWGLMPLQAIAAGLPTIISDTSGHRMFSHLANAVVPTTSTPCTEPSIYDAGNWDEPDVNALIQNMRSIISDTPTAKHKEAREYSWANAARILADTIPQGHQLQDTQWEQSDVATVPVTALKNITADIGRHHIVLTKGQQSRIPVNAKNVLLESGSITSP